MSFYGPTFHVTPVDLCIILKCNLYTSFIMFVEIKLFQIVLIIHYKYCATNGSAVGGKHTILPEILRHLIDNADTQGTIIK